MRDIEFLSLKIQLKYKKKLMLEAEISWVDSSHLGPTIKATFVCLLKEGNLLVLPLRGELHNDM